ncbi:hypothetical protein PV326_006766 [Microctonus aethiopoides]|nr:hypothetical protein PV326_006766 [Microctonus aethiopoides]
MEMRRRLVPTSDDYDLSNKLSSQTAKKTSDSFGLKPIIIFILFGILFLGYLGIAYNIKPTKFGSSAIDSLASSLNLHKPFYAVIIDAGSTGSRVLAFTFHTSIVSGDLVLDDEFFAEVKPGLSNFADNPKEGVKTLASLVDKAKNVIPKSAWAHTPIDMKATAGLRLLPKDKADMLLEECKKYLKKSGFMVKKNFVSIMDGVNEGIYAWFTVNFLVGRFSSSYFDNTAAVLDLGGGSTQITYVPNEQERHQLQKHVHEINVFNQNMSLYTYSHLGMGLMAARKAILTSDIDLEQLDTTSTVEIRSECINPIVTSAWSYGGIDYLVKGPVNGSHIIVKASNYGGTDENRPIVKFSDCMKIVKKYTDTIKEKPVGLNKHDIYTVSYYFDRAAETGLIDPKDGGVITLQSFHKTALDTCNYPNVDQPFMCLDLTYIYVLLRDCFELEPSTKLNLYKKYNGHELSWSLGSAFSLFQNDI